MKVEFLLKQILMERGLYGHGIVKELADYLGIHRHSVRNMLNGDAKTISMSVLGDICRWLRERHVPEKDLPRSLFGTRAPGLWEAVAGTEQVTMYLGERRQVLGTEADAPGLWTWVSRADCDVANAITKQLYPLRGSEGTARLFDTRYVPFRFETSERAERQEYFREDTRRAKKMFSDMRRNAADATSILIGSQEVNYLVEVMVADLFSCDPFVPVARKANVPFHMLFRHPTCDMRSCFGSLSPPPGCEGEPVPGIYYVDKNNEWVVCPWVPGKLDAGLLTVVYEPGAGSVQIVIFGFSSRATAEMARCVIPDPQRFWPPYFDCAGRRLGVYICRLIFLKASSQGRTNAPRGCKLEIVPLDVAILHEYVHPRGKR